MESQNAKRGPTSPAAAKPHAPAPGDTHVKSEIHDEGEAHPKPEHKTAGKPYHLYDLWKSVCFVTLMAVAIGYLFLRLEDRITRLEDRLALMDERAARIESQVSRNEMGGVRLKEGMVELMDALERATARQDKPDGSPQRPPPTSP